VGSTQPAVAKHAPAFHNGVDQPALGVTRHNLLLAVRPRKVVHEVHHSGWLRNQQTVGECAAEPMTSGGGGGGRVAVVSGC
jgi:hypothetical protein